MSGSFTPAGALVALMVAGVIVRPADAATAAATGVLEPFGLSGYAVTSLAVYGDLYAGTIDRGVFHRDAGNPSDGWASLGLLGKRIRAVYPHASGPLGIATTAGLEGDPMNPDSGLVYCLDMNQPPWVPTDSGMVRADIYAVWSLDGFPSPAICGETFAATIGPKGGVWRRPFGGTRWEHVLELGFATGNVVRARQDVGHVWAGGENALMAPWIARSTNRGDTWHVTYLDLAGDNACNALALHPDDPNVAYAGMEGPVLKTTNGGATWERTGLAESQAYIYGVALDSGSPSHVLAGGMVQNPNNWALWESFDGGATWAVVPPPASVPGATGISSIVADPARAGVFYLATFGHGVWRYRSASGGVGGPPVARIELAPSTPNPATRRATLRFEIPAWLSQATARISVYDVRGEHVRLLADGPRSSGAHVVVWGGDDAAGRPVEPGVYFARLQVGPHQLSRKIVLVR